MDIRLSLWLRAAHFVYPRLHARVQKIYGPTNWWQDEKGRLLLGWEATDKANGCADALNDAQGVAAMREP